MYIGGMKSHIKVTVTHIGENKLRKPRLRILGIADIMAPIRPMVFNDNSSPAIISVRVIDRTADQVWRTLESYNTVAEMLEDEQQQMTDSLIALSEIIGLPDTVFYFTDHNSGSLAAFPMSARALIAVLAGVNRIPYFVDATSADTITFGTLGRQVMEAETILDLPHGMPRTSVTIGACPTFSVSTPDVSTSSITGLLSLLNVNTKFSQVEAGFNARITALEAQINAGLSTKAAYSDTLVGNLKACGVIAP